MGYKSKLKFSEAMMRFGLIPPNNIIADGKLHLCKYSNDGLSYESGWYVFSNKIPAIGLFGCFDLNRSKRWQNTKTESLNDDERSEYLKRIYKLRYVIDKYKTANGNRDGNINPSIVNSDNKVKYFKKVCDYVIKYCEYKHTKPRCLNCDKPVCSSRIANHLFDTYGIHTFYRVTIFEIGIAMGLHDPGNTYDKENLEQRPAYIREKSQIKSQVERWKKWKAPLNKKRHTVTPIVTP